ncbi:MAG: 4-(cytidine 5'-diphospho)-2-C-methyl-D-erythritol kinase [Halioglobus sp.]
MNGTLELLSPAKLNLFLHITGRRADGYHTLQTLFQLLDWGDDMRFEANNSGKITLDMPALDIPADQNLVVKAASALQSGNLGAHISVIKRIPDGGGLGGGSSNAATTLLALNYLWELGLNSETLAALGSQLGADVPVFVHGKTAWAEGIGEQLTPVELPPAWYFIVAPGCKVSTAEIFSHEQLTRDASAIKMAAFFEGHSRNDCQNLVRNLYSEVNKALNWLNNFGESKLTGTGACIFASFNTRAEAETAQRALPSQWQGFIARGINTSPVLSSLV